MQNIYASIENIMKDRKKVVGGNARAASLSAKERSDIAKKAATARWAKHLQNATHEGEIEVAGLSLPVAVTADGNRLMISKAFMTALGRPWKGSYKNKELPNFISAKNLRPFVTDEVLENLSPIEFVNARGQKSQGYKAELLQMVCDVYLDARNAGEITSNQEAMADQAELLIRSFAKLGIIALVDEATGYQRDRAKDALSKILEKFIAKELQPWIKTFPDKYYEGLFRLRGLEFEKDNVRRPQYFGRLTNNIIYKRLAPGVLEELKKTSPKTKTGNRKGTLHQKLTPELGHPKLREHLASVTTIMALSDDYPDFMTKLNSVHPVYGETMQLNFEW
jgi:hypothetical protein